MAVEDLEDGDHGVADLEDNLADYHPYRGVMKILFANEIPGNAAQFPSSQEDKP